MTSNQKAEARPGLSGSLNRPAIGLDAIDRDADIETYVQAATRAQRYDAHVLVAADATDTRLQTRLTSLEFDVTIIEVTGPAQREADQALCTAGKDIGLPGVLLHPAPDAEIAYHESIDAFQHSDEYVMPARLAADDTDADLIVGIPATATDADLDHLTRHARAFVDTVLVVADTAHDDHLSLAAHDDVSLIDADADTAASATQALFDHVEHHYSDYDALVLLDAGSDHDPGWIPALTDALTTENADLVVGQPEDTDTESSDSVYPRVTTQLRDEFTLGTAEQADTKFRPGLQALSPTAVSQLTIPRDSADLSSTLLETAITTGLSVCITNIDTTHTDPDTGTDTDHTPSTEPVSEPARNPERDEAPPPSRAPSHTPTTNGDSASVGQTDNGHQEAVSRATDPAHDSEAVPEDFIVDADAAVTPVLSVVIPTMNEEDGIGTCLDWVEEAVAELRIPTEIIVSDSSTDRTPDIARDRGAIVVEPDEPGYGYAYRYAFERARGDYIAMGDADTTYDFSEIPRLLDHLHETGADIVMGSRLEGEIKPGSMPALHKYVGNPLLTRFLNTFYDAGVSDAHSGFRVLTRDAVEALDVGSDGMEFASEMIMDASVKGLTVEEVPITYHERVGEETLDSFRDGWRHVRFMLVNAPGNLFSVPAVLLFGLGILMLALSAAEISLGDLTFSVHTTIAGSLLTIIGYQIGTLGVFSTIAADPIKKSTDELSDWITDSVQLEHGLAVGGAIFLAGTGYAAVMTGRWLTTGQLPLVVPNMLAFTAIIIGVQTAFNSFYLSILANTTDTEKLQSK